jgi:DNA polymerase III sliding clamp (beta) subunit (PCNA family)
MNTEITLPGPELKTALSGLNKVAGRNPYLPVLNCIKISRQKNGLVTLQGTDLDTFATYHLESNQPGEPVELLVPMEQLNQAFKANTSKQDMQLVCDGTQTRLRYRLGGCPLNLPVNTLPVDEWPPAPTITADSSPLPPGFGEALKQAMQCRGEDQSRQVLRGACLDARDAKAHYVVGTNGQFLYSANSFHFPLKDAIIVPDSKFISGSGLLDDEPCSLAVQPGKKPSEVRHICLQNQQWQFVTREIEGQYPNWKQAVPTINRSWTLVKLSPPAMEQLLKVIPNLPGHDGKHNTIKLRMGPNALWIEGRNKDDADWTKLAVEGVTSTGKAKEIAVNRDYLLPALKFGLNELHILDELSPMVCSKDGKRIVIMPVNLKGPPPAKPATPAPQTSSTTTPQPEAEAQPERKPDMARTAAKPEAPKPAVQPPSLIDQVEQIKDTLKNVVRDLNLVVDAVKAVEKDQRVSEKEVEAARATLRKLQQVTI